jgi:hypothetical protein
MRRMRILRLTYIHVYFLIWDPENHVQSLLDQGKEENGDEKIPLVFKQLTRFHHSNMIFKHISLLHFEDTAILFFHFNACCEKA